MLHWLIRHAPLIHPPHIYPNPSQSPGAYYGFHGVVSFFDEDDGTASPLTQTTPRNSSAHNLNALGLCKSCGGCGGAVPAAPVLDGATHLPADSVNGAV